MGIRRVEVEGLENLQEVEGESVLLAPNHTTAWDAWVGSTWALSSRKRLVERPTDGVAYRVLARVLSTREATGVRGSRAAGVCA